jgi:hypothetical protein
MSGQTPSPAIRGEVGHRPTNPDLPPLVGCRAVFEPVGHMQFKRLGPVSDTSHSHEQAL